MEIILIDFWSQGETINAAQYSQYLQGNPKKNAQRFTTAVVKEAIVGIRLGS